MDYRSTPTITAIVGQLAPDTRDFNEALARLTAEVVFNSSAIHLFKYIEANKIQTMLIGRWAAEVAVMTSALAPTWNLEELQESYRSMEDPLTMLSYYSLWIQLNEASPDMSWIPRDTV
jgi:hypothetical protein